MEDDYWNQENNMGIGAGISSSPKLIDNKIIFGNDSGLLFALDFNGKLLWKLPKRKWNKTLEIYHRRSDVGISLHYQQERRFIMEYS